MTATNMCSNFGGKWDSRPKYKFNCVFGIHHFEMIVILQHKTTKKSPWIKIFVTNFEFINKIHYVSCNIHTLILLAKA